MNLTVNGQTKNIATNTSLQALVQEFVKNPAHAIAEVNGAIIVKTAWAATALHDGDKIELVAFVGGG